MNHRRSRSAVLALAAGLVAAVSVISTPSPLAGQEAAHASLDPRFGVAIPVGGLDDVTDVSVSAGAGFASPIHPRVAIRGDLRYSRLAGATDDRGDALAPSLDLFTVSAGVEFDFPRPRWQDVPFSFRLALGVGVTDMSGSLRHEDGTRTDFDQTYPTLTGGARIGLPITDRIQGFVLSEALLILAEEEDTAVLTERVPGADPIGTAWTLPLSAGLRVTLH